MTRKSPIRHKVRSHIKLGKRISSFMRGKGKLKHRAFSYIKRIPKGTKLVITRQSDMTMQAWFKTKEYAEEHIKDLETSGLFPEGTEFIPFETGYGGGYAWDIKIVRPDGRISYTGGKPDPESPFL